MKKSVQGTSVSIQNQGILIQGNSGIGKTTLALKLIEKGADLISDDITEISLENNRIFCEVQPKLYGKIELRGLGILGGLKVCSKAPLVCLIRLTKEKKERCPFEIKYDTFFGKKIPVFEFFSCETTCLWVLYALKVVNGELTCLKE